jgi:hypothetical protein
VIFYLWIISIYVDIIHKFENQLKIWIMKNVNFTIISEEMIWLWYYDELGNKHLKELLGREAKDFIQDFTSSKALIKKS